MKNTVKNKYPANQEVYDSRHKTYIMKPNYIILYLIILCFPIHSYCQNIDSISKRTEGTISQILFNPNNGWEKLPEGKYRINIDNHPTICRMIQTAPPNLDISIVYFLIGEYYLDDEYQLVMYTENNKNIFIDSDLKKYTSLKKLLKKRYGSVKRYKELYAIHNTMKNCAVTIQLQPRTFVFTQAKIHKKIREFAEKDYIIIALNTKNKFHDLKHANNSYYLIYYNKKNVILYDRTRDEMRVGNVYKIKNHYYCAFSLDSHKRGSRYE